ncbi:MAG: hypothetical protein HKN85_10855 [Gammaproteobacteria bacterium]|nr:hypothetical protein [Gammaproteobacteria bacterium]
MRKRSSSLFDDSDVSAMVERYDAVWKAEQVWYRRRDCGAAWCIQTGSAGVFETGETSIFTNRGG